MPPPSSSSDNPLLTHLIRHHHQHFTALSLAPTTNFLHIKAAYHRSILRLHPDKSLNADTTAAYRDARKAFEVLKRVLDADSGCAPASSGAWNNPFFSSEDEEELQEYSRPKTKPGSYAWTLASETYDEEVRGKVFSHTFKTGAFQRKMARARGEGEGYAAFGSASGGGKGKGKMEEKQQESTAEFEESGFSFGFDGTLYSGARYTKGGDHEADGPDDEEYEENLFDDADEIAYEYGRKHDAHDKRASAL